MGLFDRRKTSKGESRQNNVYSSVPYNVQINKYNSKQAVLDLIAYISTADNDFDAWNFFKDFYNNCAIPVDELDKMDNQNSLIEEEIEDIKKRIRDVISETIDEIEESNGDFNLTIAVGGGYSSGKSSFLNHLLKLNSLLPTGIEPVSIVNTFLNTSNDINDIRVRGKNLKDSYVLLDKEVLECIQHASKSKTYVASVLNALTIDIPMSDTTLQNLTFIDTPGYNNSAEKNIENNVTDEETALNAYKKASAIFWCIDMEAGTVPNRDLDMLKRIQRENPEKAIVVIFTKRDKKELADQKKILKNANKILESNLSNTPISILAFSDRLDSPFLIKGSDEINDIIRKIWKDCNLTKSNDFAQSKKQKITDIFKEKQEIIIEFLNTLEEERTELSVQKAEAQKKFTQAKEFNKSMLDNIKEIIKDDYPTLVYERDCYRDLASGTLNKWIDLIQKIKEKLNDATIFSGRNNLESIINVTYKRINELTDTYDDLMNNQIATFDSEALDNIYEDIKITYESFDNNGEENKTRTQDDYKQIVKYIKEFNKFKSFLKIWENKSSEIFELVVNSAIKGIKDHMSIVPTLEREDHGNIFSAIAADNIKGFVDCLSAGVNMAECNDTGYTPITYVAKSGNNQMMKYLIENDINMNLPDKRGYTPFETAVICHYQDICEMLIESDPFLKDTNHPIEELLNANTFSNWLEELN